MGKMLTLGQLDAAKDLTKYVGRTVDWHGLPTILVRLKDGSFGLPVWLECRCGKSKHKVYMTSGIHAGAWPYGLNIYGKYQLNVRDQEYVCPKCRSELAEKEAIMGWKGPTIAKYFDQLGSVKE